MAGFWPQQQPQQGRQPPPPQQQQRAAGGADLRGAYIGGCWSVAHQQWGILLGLEAVLLRSLGQVRPDSHCFVCFDVCCQSVGEKRNCTIAYSGRRCPALTDMQYDHITLYETWLLRGHMARLLNNDDHLLSTANGTMDLKCPTNLMVCARCAGRRRGAARR